jgi:hypothetical protein
MPTTAPVALPITWEFEVPLVTNRHMLAALAKALLGGALVVAALVALLLGLQGEWAVVPRVAVLLVGIGVGLYALSLAVMALVFGNALRTRFVVDTEGVHFSTPDRVARAASRGSILLGAVLGSGATTGSGLLAAATTAQSLHWRGAFRCRPEPDTHSVAFRNGWRTLMRVYCPPAQYAAIVAAITAQMASHDTASRNVRTSPLGAWLMRTALVIAATLPVFAVHDTFGFSLLPPFLLLCFGLATVWFVRPMAWVVLGLLAVIVVLMIAGALDVRVSYLGHEPYRRLTTMSGDDWALTGLAALGLSGLLWLAVATLRRRITPALAADLETATLELGGDD